MYYFYENEVYIFRQEINVDKVEIEQLKKQIIKNCSRITHMEYDTDYAPRLNNSLVRYYKETFVGYKDYFEESRRVMHYSYDLFIPPKLVKLIDRLLNDDASVIAEINNYDYKSEITIDDIINAKNDELEITNKNSYSEKIKILKDLEKLAYDKELNKNQQSTEEFYHKLLSMIIMKNPIMYRKKDLREFMYFFDVDIKIENGVHVSLEKNAPKTRKKTK